MKKRLISILVLFSVLASNLPLYAEDTEAQDYNTEDFPQSLKDLRRFGIITCGSMPFVMLDLNIAYSIKVAADNGFDSSHSINPFASPQDNGFTQDEQIGLIISSMCVSAGIGLTDFVVNLIKRSSKQKKLQKEKNNDLIIIPISQDPDAVKIKNPQNKTENQDNFEEEISAPNETDDLVSEEIFTVEE